MSRHIFIALLLAVGHSVSAQVNGLPTDEARKLSSSSTQSDNFLLTMFEVVLTTMESKLRRVENLDRAVQQLMLKLEAMEKTSLTNHDVIIGRLETVAKSASHCEAVQSTIVDKLEDEEKFGSGQNKRRRDEESEEDLVAEPSETHARFWIPSAQASLQNTSAGLRRRRLVKKPAPGGTTTTVSSAEVDDTAILANNNNMDILVGSALSLSDAPETDRKVLDQLMTGINRLSNMLTDVHNAIIEDNDSGQVEERHSSKTTKLDILLDKLWPLLQVNDKMDEVKHMLDGTKSSVDHLIPQSEELLNQTHRQEKAISEIHSDLKEKTNAIMKELSEVERELLRNKQNLNSIYSNVGLAGIKPDADVVIDAGLRPVFDFEDLASLDKVTSKPAAHTHLKNMTFSSRATTLATTTTATTTTRITAPTTTERTSSPLSLDSTTLNLSKMRMRSTTVSGPTTTTTTTTTTSPTAPKSILITTPSPTVASSITTPSTVTSKLNMTTSRTSTVSTFFNNSISSTLATMVESTTSGSSLSSNTTGNSTAEDMDHTVSCADLKRQSPAADSGVFYLQQPGDKHKFLKVFCDMETLGGGWTVIQRRDDFGEEHREDFNRGWKEYKEGFGDPEREFWIGNENIYTLTKNDDFELRVELDDFDGNRRYAEYKHFKLGAEDEDYRLEIGGYLGNAGDSLNDPWYGSNQRPFSTMDKDNDRSSLNCASMLKGGWWWKSCGRGLNGVYMTNPQDLTARQGIVWFRWRGWDYSLKRSRMMIRPKNFVNEDGDA